MLSEEERRLLSRITSTLNEGQALAIEAMETSLFDSPGGKSFAEQAITRLKRASAETRHLPEALRRVVTLPANQVSILLRETFDLE
jgi:hypothetical protein